MDLQEEHIRERQSLETNFEELNQSIKLKYVRIYPTFLNFLVHRGTSVSC